MKHLKWTLASLLALVLLATVPLAACAEDAGMTAEEMLIKGDSYRWGNDGQQNYELAIKWYQKAAELGYTRAMYSLAEMYEFGNGVEKNDELAFQWYLKAAELGYVKAMNRIGVAYSSGFGVEQDEELAFQWYLKAADLGESYAMRNMAGYYRYGIAEEQNDELAAYWYQKAAEGGNPYNVTKLAMEYLDGYIGDLSTLRENDGDMAAEDMLWKGFQYQMGLSDYFREISETQEYMVQMGVSEWHQFLTEPGLSLLWYLKAADLGNTDAMVAIAMIYEHGIPFSNGTSVNRNPMIDWWAQKAADLGNTTVSLVIAQMRQANVQIECFDSVEPDADMAARWYQKAADLGNEDAKAKLQ